MIEINKAKDKKGNTIRVGDQVIATREDKGSAQVCIVEGLGSKWIKLKWTKKDGTIGHIELPPSNIQKLVINKAITKKEIEDFTRGDIVKVFMPKDETKFVKQKTESGMEMAKSNLQQWVQRTGRILNFYMMNQWAVVLFSDSQPAVAPGLPLEVLEKV